MVDAIVCGKQKRRGQAGFTLVELIVAVAISALIVLGSLVFLRYTITVADENRDKTMATLQVQYVGFWISEDVVQAQEICLGGCDAEDAGDPDGFPLILKWDDWDTSQSETITYYVEDMEDGDLWRLMRTRDVYEGVDLVSSATSLVAEHLVPWSDAEGEGTRVCRMGYDAEYDIMKSLVVEVAARADRSEASSTYEIYPRAVVDWHPQDVDGHYNGPECPVS